MRVFAAATTILIVSHAISFAGESLDITTTQSLYELCMAQSGDRTVAIVQQVECEAYLKGVGSMMQLVGVVAVEGKISSDTKRVLKPMSVCGNQSPTNATNTEMRQVFINWAERNPTRWQLTAGIGAAMAIEDTWPCVL